ncbi:MAG TPA: MerR family transcriptional regulator [Candidatus Limnocylindria bacterium]|nr:MerR family transcriptional regulator [Candidatus Limnocylindria bacterium]
MSLAHVRPDPRSRRTGHRIGEAARIIGVSPSALRLWERQGLVSPARSSGRYRLYTDADLDRLAQVQRMRQVERVNAPGIRRVLGAAGSNEVTGTDGAVLRDLRRARGLSLRAAGERAGLSPSLIGAIERGAAVARVASLQRLTSAYGTTVAALIGRPGRHGRVTRARRRRRLELGHDSIRIEQLADDATLLEPQLFHLAPGSSSDGAYAHAGEEFLFVLSGAITVWVGERERYRLAEGDALVFPSNLPHRWRNGASRETRLLWINTPPTF